MLKRKNSLARTSPSPEPRTISAEKSDQGLKQSGLKPESADKIPVEAGLVQQTHSPAAPTHPPRKEETEAQVVLIKPIQLPETISTKAAGTGIGPMAPTYISVAGPARLRWRHFAIAISFVVCVVIPSIMSVLYLYTLARDQFVSSMSFSVRKEEFQSAIGLLGGLTKLSGSAGGDVDILNEFILSQQMIEKVARDTDLTAAFSAGWPNDFVFAYDPTGSIEDLQAFWRRQIELNISSGLIQIRVSSYDPGLSVAINQSIFKHSGELINALSAEARRDATHYSAQELVIAEKRLADARAAMTEFRLRTQIVDPASAAQSQLGVLNTLNAQLAEELVKQDLVRMQGQRNDPRAAETERRIQAITNRIDAEKAKFGPGGEGAGGQDYATLFSQYERLTAELRFGEEAYRVALVSNDNAQAEAQRKSRYIVAHVEPTMAQASSKPQRAQYALLSFVFLLLVWSMGILVYYSIRDRR